MIDKKEKGKNLISRLFGPSADYAGEKMKDKLKIWTENKEKDNIAGHINKVNSGIDVNIITENEQKPTIDQMKLFSNWSEGAGKVDPNQGVIAQLWQKLLKDIFNGNFVNEEMIEKLKMINPKEAELLLKIKKAEYFNYKNSEELYYIESLKNHGLVKKIITPLYSKLGSLFLIYLVFFVPIAILILTANILYLYFPNLGIRETIIYSFFIDLDMWKMIIVIFFVIFFMLLMKLLIDFFSRTTKFYCWILTYMGIELTKGINLEKTEMNKPSTKNS